MYIYIYIYITVTVGISSTECSTFHVMVARLRLFIAWETAAAGIQVFAYTIILPPLVVPGTSAGQLWHALFHSPLTGPMLHAVSLLRQKAKIVILHHETDGAYANDKLAAHLYKLFGAGQNMFEHAHCALHANQLIEVALLAVFPKLLSRMYSLTKLFKTSGYFMKLVQSLEPYILETLQVRQGAPPDEMQVFLREMINYIRCHRNRFVRLQNRIRHHWLRLDGAESGSDSDDDDVSSSSTKPGARARAMFEKAAERFSAAWNGPLWESGVCVYYQPHGDTKSRVEIAREMAFSAKAFLFKTVPSSPAANKWTKLGPSADFMTFALCPHRLLAGAFSKLKQPKEEATLQGDLNDLDPDLRKDVAFSAIAGSRYKASKEFLGAEETPMLLMRLCLVLEPLRHLTGSWMKCASDVEDPCRPPRLMDMVNPAWSPIRHALQYLSTLLDGRTSRLVLLWRLAGCGSLNEWYAHRPLDVRMFRRVCLLASGWIYRRHECKWNQCPWLLVGVADKRRSMADRRKIIRTFERTRICCLRPGMSRSLRSREDWSEDLMLSDVWLTVLYFFALLVTMVVADVEWRHQRNRADSHMFGQTCIAQFSAKYVGREGRDLHAAQIKRNGIHQARIAALAPPPPPLPMLGAAAGQRMDLVRAPTPFSLWRTHMIRRDQELGVLQNVASKEDWARRLAEWDRVEPQDQHFFFVLQYIYIYIYIYIYVCILLSGRGQHRTRRSTTPRHVFGRRGRWLTVNADARSGSRSKDGSTIT